MSIDIDNMTNQLKASLLVLICATIAACGGGSDNSASAIRSSSSVRVTSSSSEPVNESSASSESSSESIASSVSSTQNSLLVSSVASVQSSSSVQVSSVQSSSEQSSQIQSSAASSVPQASLSSSSSIPSGSSGSLSSMTQSSQSSSASSIVATIGDEGAVYCLNPGQEQDIGGSNTLPNIPPSTPNHSDMDKMSEHMAMLSMMDYSQATHAAVNDGRWCNPDTWHNKLVPGHDANVVIPTGFHVEYDQQSEARLHTVRVDGTLAFSTTDSSRMIVDTLFVDPRGTLSIGSKVTPVSANVNVEIVIADNGDIDTTWDTHLQSRGIVAHGTTTIHGAYKKTHLKIAVDPMQGDTTLTLVAAPAGWKVGDKLVITGTQYFGWKWDNSIRDVRYFGTQDEVRTITAINGVNVTFNQGLEYNHGTPREDLKVSVANFTRNVSVATENANTVAIHQRGHVMFMHTNKVDVRYAEFNELGRTSKKEFSFDVGNVNPVRPNSNVRGRYSFHFHRSGTADVRNPAIAVGNAVFGSPGWGFTHHDSHAMFHDNASFNTFGAGFVAETGNETGIWSGNIAIKAEGNRSINPKNGNEREAFDMGRTGDGFWFQGRLVRSTDNIAASVNHGFVYLHRGSGMKNFPPERFMLPEALGLARDATPDDAPIRHFDGNESYASTVGLYVVKANPKQDHDIMTVLSDFKAWEVRIGAAIEYTSHYIVKDFDLIGARSAAFFRPTLGLEFGNNTSDMVASNVRIENFPVGIELSKHQVNESDEGKDQFVIIGGEYINVATPLLDYDPGVDQVLALSDLVSERFQINIGNEAFEYLSSATNAGVGVPYIGLKTDSIGDNPLPAGTDGLGINNSDMIANVEINGYYEDVSSGDIYTIVENYFSDRATGEIHKYGFKTRLGSDVVGVLGNQFFAWRNARNAGMIDINSAPPVGSNDSAVTSKERDVSINLTANDTDPEGDTLRIDGVVQPRNGTVFSGGSSVVYRPGLGFTGTDTFYYWVTDGNGNYAKANVSVTVTP